MGHYQNELIEMEDKFNSILSEVIKRNEYIEDVFAEMQRHRYLIANQGLFLGANDEEYFTEGIELAWQEYNSKYWED